MDSSLPGDHAFEPVNSQQITEDDVRTFLQSFPEFKDCRFEVEIVQANHPNTLQTLTTQYDDMVSGQTGYVGTSAQHVSLLPPELRDQYVRVDCLNLPYENPVPSASAAYTRVEPDSEYVPPTEADFKDALWSFERTSQHPTSSSSQLGNPVSTNVTTPYYSIQHQHSDGASSKTSTPAVEDELPPVYRVPPAPTTVHSSIIVDKTSHSPVSNASSSVGSLVELRKPADYRSTESPVVVKEHFSGTVQPSDYHKETTRTHPEETPPATNQSIVNSIRRYPRDEQAGADAGVERSVNVSELSKRFAQIDLPSANTGSEHIERKPTDVQRSRSSTVGGTPSLPEQERSAERRQRASTRRSRTAESSSLPKKNDTFFPRQTMERRRNRHSGHEHLRHSSREMTRKDQKQKGMRRKHRASPTISFSKNQKYCYIDGEKFKMVDYSDIVDQQVGGYLQQRQYGVPLIENGYYPTMPASLKPLDSALFGEYAAPQPRLLNQMPLNEGLYAGGRSANYLCSTLPRRGKHVANQEVPMVNRVYPRRRHRNRVHSTHRDQPLYDSTHMMTSAPATRQWNKLASFPKNGRPQFYNPPYTHFSMWA